MANRRMDLKPEVRILIVEDNDAKYRDISNRFRRYVDSGCEFVPKITRAKSAFSATTTVSNHFFDVIILDLKIPHNDAIDGENSEDLCAVENSKEVYKFITKNSEFCPFLIVGLTALEKEEYAELFSENSIFSIEDYATNTWFENIVYRINFISKGKSALSNFLENNFSYDAILLVARQKNEFEPILASIDWLDGHSTNPRLGRRKNGFGRIELSNGRILNIGIVCLGEMGLSVAAAYTTQLIHMFRPRHFAMLGMCCGFRGDENRSNTKLGDVIIANRTANWDEGRYEDNAQELKEDVFFHQRVVDRNPSIETIEGIEAFLEDSKKRTEELIKVSFRKPESQKIINDYEMKVNKELFEEQQADPTSKKVNETYKFDTNSKIHFESLVSGSSVVDSSKIIGEIRNRFPSSIGLEMEAHAVYSAVKCCYGRKPNTVVIKGVADHGDGTKAKIIQGLASSASFLVYRELLESFEIEDS